MSRDDHFGSEYNDDRYERDDDLLRFEHSNGVVTKLWEWDDGRWERESIDREETWTYANGQLIKQEFEYGRVETEVYTDPDGDGVFTFSSKSYGSTANAGNSSGAVVGSPSRDDLDRYEREDDLLRFEHSNGVVTKLWEWDDGRWERESIDRDETWTYANGQLIKQEFEYGRVETEIYTDPDGDGVFAFSSKSYGSTANAGNSSGAVVGSPSRDDLDGGDRDDSLYGHDDHDHLYGMKGDDVIHGGNGRDTAQFSERDNRINLGVTRQQNTGDGLDRLISIENVDAGSGDDVVIGNQFSNSLNGEDGHDRLLGRAGRDRLDGGDGHDRLFGGRGADRLFGGDGRDLLVGGRGKDHVWGQGGRDTFRIARGVGYTVIEDFVDGQDRIHLGSGRAGLSLTNRGDDVLLYQRNDLMAIVEDAAGDLQLRGNYLI